MYELKKNGKVFTSKFVGTGPSSYEKKIYGAAVSQRLRNTGLDNKLFSQVTVPLEKLTAPKLVKELPVFHRVHNCLSLVPFPSQMNPVCALPSREYMSDWLSRLSHGSN